MVHPCLAALSFRHLHAKQARKEAQNAIIVVCYSREKLVLATGRNPRRRNLHHDTMLSRATPELYSFWIMGRFISKGGSYGTIP